MGNSLLDQLKQSGLVDEKRARKAHREKQREAKKQRRQGAANSSQPHLQQQQAEKAQRDRALNEQRRREADRRAVQAQIRQLIHHNRITDCSGDTPYHFTDGKRIKSLHLSEAAHRRLSRGELVIAKLDGAYELVPAPVAEKIRQRDAASILQHDGGRQTNEDDDYADYRVPDDLIW